MTKVRTLILLRHAKAGDGHGLPDWERPLTERGERDAGRAGEEVRRLGLEPEVVLCSPARRTRRTAQLAFPSVEVRHQQGIYQARPEELLEALRLVEPELRTVALCGHNPSVHELAVMLTGGEHAFPPGAFAVIRFASPWGELWPGEGSVAARWEPGGVTG